MRKGASQSGTMSPDSDLPFSPFTRQHVQSLPRARGNCGFPPPVAEEGNPQFLQRSKNARTSVSPQHFSGTAKRTGGAKRRMRSPRNGSPASVILSVSKGSRPRRKRSVRMHKDNSHSLPSPCRGDLPSAHSSPASRMTDGVSFLRFQAINGGKAKSLASVKRFRLILLYPGVRE